MAAAHAVGPGLGGSLDLGERIRTGGRHKERSNRAPCETPELVDRQGSIDRMRPQLPSTSLPIEARKETPSVRRSQLRKAAGSTASAGPNDMRSKAADLISAVTGMPGREVERVTASAVTLAIRASPPASRRTSTIGGSTAAMAATVAASRLRIDRRRGRRRRARRRGRGCGAGRRLPTARSTPRQRQPAGRMVEAADAGRRVVPRRSAP